jgi:hypothetical protein
MNYDSTQDVLNHKEAVEDLLAEVSDALEFRIRNHDDSKLVEPEKSMFDKWVPELQQRTFGTPEYAEALAQMGEGLQHHYQMNRHHPEYGEYQEEWQPVVGFESHYAVSSFGRVRSVDREAQRKGASGSHHKIGQLLTQDVTPRGYCRIQLMKDGKRKNMLVHRMVADAFIPNPDNKPAVNHKNGMKAHNHVANLEWATYSENLQHAYDNNLKHPAVKYVVTCEELDITTLGCLKMKQQLHALGHTQIHDGGIWNAIHGDGQYQGFTFTGAMLQEHHEHGINRMNLLDLIEMVCDWIAAAEARGNQVGIAYQCQRFGIDEQLANILQNTIECLEHQGFVNNEVEDTEESEE